MSQLGPLDRAVELLDRALAYTRVALSDVRPDPAMLARPTPCRDWDLGRLLVHMEDALDAFTEAAEGFVVVETVPRPSSPVEVLRDKACALLGAWTEHRPAADVRIGDLHLAGPVLVATAALEITVHGWDVAQATGSRTPVPESLAQALLRVAGGVLTPEDRDGRFAPVQPLLPGAGADVRLLAFLGRDPRHQPARRFTPGGDPRGVAS